MRLSMPPSLGPSLVPAYLAANSDPAGCGPKGGDPPSVHDLRLAFSLGPGPASPNVQPLAFSFFLSPAPANGGPLASLSASFPLPFALASLPG